MYEKITRTEHEITSDQSKALTPENRTAASGRGQEFYGFSYAVRREDGAPRALSAQEQAVSERLRRAPGQAQRLVLDNKPAEVFLTSASGLFPGVEALDSVQLQPEEKIRLTITRKTDPAVLGLLKAQAVLFREGTAQQLKEHQEKSRLGVALKHVLVEVNGKQEWFRAQVTYDSIDLKEKGFGAAVNWAPMAKAFLAMGPSPKFESYQAVIDQAKEWLTEQLNALNITGPVELKFSFKTPKQNEQDKCSPHLTQKVSFSR